ncbi:hypothetical protein [Actinomadura sp. HBU206391]|nr:hypothetical protein [Actinomadura sp. HBU206391]MBC6456715.1 hypothetical protein [Actinomadura sp. HBU206391]
MSGAPHTVLDTAPITPLDAPFGLALDTAPGRISGSAARAAMGNLEP